MKDSTARYFNKYIAIRRLNDSKDLSKSGTRIYTVLLIYKITEFLQTKIIVDFRYHKIDVDKPCRYEQVKVTNSYSNLYRDFFLLSPEDCEDV